MVRRRSRTLPSTREADKRDVFSRARELGLHVRSRQSPYPMSDLHRYPVPDFLVDWMVIESFVLCYCFILQIITSQTFLSKLCSWTNTMTSFDYNYQNTFRCNLCNVHSCHARAIRHKRKNTGYNSLPQSILGVVVK